MPSIGLPDGSRAHADLSPSAAERWISCPASVRVEAELQREEVESPYAREGTAAHALAEIMARFELLKTIAPGQLPFTLAAWREEHGITIPVEIEMMGHVEDYLELLRERLTRHPMSQLLLEQRMPTGIPGCWGTSDAVVVSPVHVEIIDLKYGQGVQVWADDNPQLQLYGIGALETYGDLLGDVEAVYVTVFQPRLEHVHTSELTPEKLREWRDSIIPIAEQALQPDAPFGPSEEACRWCDARGRCRAQMEHAIQQDFGRPADLLTPDEMAEALLVVGEIEQWCSDIRTASLDLAYSQDVPIPLHKVVMSRGNRYITDSDRAIELLQAEGYDADLVSSRKVFGIGVLEKLLGKDRFAELLAPVIDKKEGKPSLVSEDDPRPAISSTSEAAKDFA